MSNNEYFNMAKDDITLGVEMRKLKIEPININKNVKEENPFVAASLSTQKKSLFSRTCQQNFKCSCVTQKKNKKLPICKKKHNSILKEPVLKLLQINGQNCRINEDCQDLEKKISTSPIINSDSLSLCALVDNCNQLRISSDTQEQISTNTEPVDQSQWWKTNLSSTSQSRETFSGMNRAGSCSQQALNPPCDVTIDELASYFETLVHIPKKMSSMAEMMYI